VALPTSIPLGDHPLVSGRSLLDYVSPPDRLVVIEAWDRVKLHGASNAIVHLSNAPERSVVIRYFDVRATHGVLIGLVIGFDQGGRVGAMPTSNTLSPRLIHVKKDENATILEIEESVSEILGWTPEEMVGHRGTEFIHPDDLDRAIGTWFEMLGVPGSTSRCRYRHQRSDGSWNWFDVKNYNLLDADERCVAVEMIDVTDEMAAHEAVRARELLLERIAEALPIGLMQIEPDGVISYANHQLGEILDTSLTTTVGDQISLLSEDDRHKFNALRGAACSGTESDLEVKIETSGQQDRWCLFSFRPLLSEKSDAEQTSIAAIVTVRDITDHKRAKVFAERQYRLLEEAQRIAHLGSFELNASDNTIAASEEMYRLFDVESGSSIEDLAKLLHPLDRDRVYGEFGRCIDDHTPLDFVSKLLLPDGTLRWVHARAEWLPDKKDGRGSVVGTMHDITDRKQAEESAEIGYQKLNEAQRLAHLGSFVQDAESGLIEPSDEASRMLGLAPDISLDAVTLMDLVHPGDRDRFSKAMGACIVDHALVDLSLRVVRTDGTLRWVLARAKWFDDERSHRGKIVGTILDVTDRKLAEDALQYADSNDSLTGLASRVAFLDRVNFALNRVAGRSDGVAVLFMDLDDFWVVNDSLGHPVGDELLAAVGHRLASLTQGSETISRPGGDEFALLIESGASLKTAEAMATRMANALAIPFVLGGTELRVTGSIGVAFGRESHDGAALFRDADLAMYLAKRKGKNRFEISNPELRETATERLVMLSALHHALDEHEFEVFYQPIVAAHDGSLTGTEALVRWRHPGRGLLRPVDFLDVAETSGLIVPIGKLVRIEALRQVEAWRKAGIVDDAFYVSVNISARQLADPTLVDNVARDLVNSGLPPSALVLEVTETDIMLDFDAGLDRLEALKRLGLRLALDDYGTGYSSLARLARLPVDIVKIDKSFIDDLTASSDGKALVQSVIDVARSLGLSTTAEGVEEPRQWTLLVEMGCNAIQGYLFGKPMPPTSAARRLRELQMTRRDVEPAPAAVTAEIR